MKGLNTCCSYYQLKSCKDVKNSGKYRFLGERVWICNDCSKAGRR